MTDAQQKKAARDFANYWKDKGYEKGESQPFWTSLLHDVYGVEKPQEYIFYEEQVKLDHTSFIDGMIPSTHVMIEQKGSGKDLMKPIRQSDGTLLTPFQQAQRYSAVLPYSQRPRWIVTCNFQEFRVYDMERPGGAPEVIYLKDLEKEYYRLNFLVKTGDEHIQKELEVSIAAGEIVGLLYDALLSQYANPDSEDTKHSLNVLCVRLVFCLYAEDAGIFGSKSQFHDYLSQFTAGKMRRALIELFDVLNTPVEQRDRYLEPELAAFPYVNGGLFAAKNIEIPLFTDELRELLLQKASLEFDWSEISPTIFGAVFESTLNPETRRAGGMHYTSIENIHRVIDPLFLDSLNAEYERVDAITVKRTKEKALKDFQNKLASLRFMDPAAGSGNFLTETYLCIRRLENRVIRQLMSGGFLGQMTFGEALNPIKVSISQFYGIEINDFAVTVAKTALWIAESQTMKETEESLFMDLEFLPLRTSANITEGNALLVDWREIIPPSELSYIMGNPPFVGKKYQTAKQKADMKAIFGAKTRGVGNLDYVTAWYRKAIEYMQHTNITAAFVSTNSIVQGEHIPLFWKNLYEKFSIQIVFARQTFRWDSEATEKAAVHCVIIGFNAGAPVSHKQIYISDAVVRDANNIHPYLIDLPNVFIENRSKPLFKCKPLVYGSFALDDGNYTISESEYKELVTKEPEIEKYIKLFIVSEEFINGKKRYCIWLKEAEPREIRKIHILDQRVKKVQEWRSTRNRKETVAAASTPMLFAEIRQPDTDYMAIPITSSERRRYIPIGYMSKDVIASNHLLVLPDATLYEFGVLMSNVHMSWMRTVAGRLKSDYNYSARIVYNNFPWCNPTDEQKTEIEKTAQGILDARSKYPSYTLAELYDPTYMPNELIVAHRKNDKAVLQAYGITSTDAAFKDEASCVALLMKMYQEETRKN